MLRRIRAPGVWGITVTLVSFFAPFLGGIVWRARVPPSVWIAGTLLACLALAAWRATPAERVEAPLRLALVPVAVALVAYFGADKLGEQLGFVGHPWHVVRARSYCVAWPLLVFATAFVGARLAPRATARRRDAIHTLACVATLLACACLAAFVRRIDRPTPDTYLATLPVVGSAQPHATEVFGDVRVLRDGCALWIARANSGPPPPSETGLWARIPGVSCAEAVTVRADDARHAWIVEVHAGEHRAFDQTFKPFMQALAPERLRGALRPASAYAALALAGVLGALASLLRRGSDLPRDASCREGVVDAQGKLTLNGDAQPLANELPGPLREGPVVAVLGPPPESFRVPAAPAIVRVLPGTLEEHRRSALAGPAFALAVVALAATPLAVALLDLG